MEASAQRVAVGLTQAARIIGTCTLRLIKTRLCNLHVLEALIWVDTDIPSTGALWRELDHGYK